MGSAAMHVVLSCIGEVGMCGTAMHAVLSTCHAGGCEVGMRGSAMRVVRSCRW